MLDFFVSRGGGGGRLAHDVLLFNLWFFNRAKYKAPAVTVAVGLVKARADLDGGCVVLLPLVVVLYDFRCFYNIDSDVSIFLRFGR